MITEVWDIYLYLLCKYLVSGIYQRRDLRLKSVKISVQGPFNKLSFKIYWGVLRGVCVLLLVFPAGMSC